MINTKILDIKQLTARVAQADPSISIDKIHVEGNVSGNIVVGHGNVIGDHNVIYSVHSLFGALINLRDSPPSISRRSPSQPPHAPRRFVGRERELNLLAGNIRDHEPVLLYGHSGLGKTTLLQKIANSEAAKSMPDGIIYLEQLHEGDTASLQDVLQRLFDRMFDSNPRIKLTDPLGKTGLVPTTPLMTVLGHLFPKLFESKLGARSDASIVEANLTTTSLLILLDEMGIEHNALNRLPALFPRSALLVASQNAPFDDTYESIQVTPLRREEAIQLFAEKSGIAIDEKTRPVIEQVCGILEDTPLAIATIANGIRQNRIQLDSLEGIQLVALVYMLQEIKPLSQDRIQAAIERSFKLLYQQLDWREREMLVDVATAPGRSVDRVWLETEGPGAEEAVRAVEDLGLLYANSPRMRLPEALRGILQSIIDSGGWRKGETLDESREALVERLLLEVEQHERDLEFVAGELGNILGLLQWAFDQNRWSAVIKLGQAIDPYLTLNGLWDVWGTVLKQVEVAARNVGDPAARAWALHQLGTREIGVGTREQAIDWLRRALELRLRNGEIHAAVYTLHNLRFLLPPGSNGQDKGRNGSDDPSGGTKKQTIVDTPRIVSWEKTVPFLKRYGDILLTTLVGVAIVAAVLLLPFMRLRLEAGPARYGPEGQVIRYIYRVDNLGFGELPGPILVRTNDRAKMICPELVDIGDHDNILDRNEEFICTSSHIIAREDVAQGSVTNIATAQAGEPWIARASLTILRDNRYVMLGIEADPDSYENVGQLITVRFHVRNPGSEPMSGAVNVISKKQLQPNCLGAQRVSQGNVVLEAGGTLTCIATFSITPEDMKAGSWTDTASVSVGDFISDEEEINISGPSALALQKFSTPRSYQESGQTIRYTYLISNRHSVPLPGEVTVVDDLVSVGCPAPQDGRLDPDETITCAGDYITTEADVKAGSITNTATARIGPIESEPVTLTIIPGLDFALDLEKTANPPVGQDITYSYVVSNLRDDRIPGPVTITDSLLQASCPALNTVGNLDDFLDPTEKLTCIGTYRISQEDVGSGSVTNAAWAHAGENRSEIRWLTVNLESPQQRPELEKSAAPTEYTQAGQVITYSYKVTNPGPAPLFGSVSIDDDKVNAECSQVIQVAQTAPGLAPGESVTCTGTYLITDEDIQNGFVTNIAWARLGKSISEPKSLTIQLGDPVDSYLELGKYAKPKTYEQEGERVIYLYRLRNPGPSLVRGRITLEDDRVQVHCPVQDVLLEPGDSLTCSGIYTIKEADMANGSVTNIAWAHVGEVLSNRATETIYASGLDLTVTTDPESYSGADQVIHYFFKVESKNWLPLFGPVTVTAIDDRTGQPFPVTCPGLSTTGNQDEFFDWKESITCTGDYFTTQEDVDALPGTEHNSVTKTAIAHAGNVSSAPISKTIPGPMPVHDLVLQPTPDADHYDKVGETITYAYVIRNQGNMTVSAPFTITDDLTGNGTALDCVTDKQRLAPGEWADCASKTYQISESNLDFENSKVISNASATAMFNGMPIVSPIVTTTIACKYPHDEFTYRYQMQSGESLEIVAGWFTNMTEEALRQANCMRSTSQGLGQRPLYLQAKPPLASLHGYVWDTAHNPVGGTRVALFNTRTRVTLYTETLTDGSYEFSGLEHDTYIVFQVQIPLKPNENKEQNFTIIPQ